MFRLKQRRSLYHLFFFDRVLIIVVVEQLAKSVIDQQKVTKRFSSHEKHNMFSFSHYFH